MPELARLIPTESQCQEFNGRVAKDRSLATRSLVKRENWNGGACSGWRLVFFLFLRKDRFRGKFQHLGAHFFAGLELDDGPLGDRDIGRRCIWIASDPSLPDFDFEDSEISKFNRISFRERFGDIIEGLLNDVQDLLLRDVRVGADADNQVALCKCHRVMGFNGPSTVLGITPTLSMSRGDN